MEGVNGQNYFDINEILNPTQEQIRKVRGGINSPGEVVSEGDQTLFKDTNDLGKDQFLNLLVTQLKYQDPLNPEADTEFVAQLAQFSSLENSESMEKTMTSLAESMGTFMQSQELNAASQTNSSAVGLLGKTVRLRKEDVSFNGQLTEFPVHLEKGKAAQVQIIDKEGNLVATLAATPEEGSSDTTVQWDGKLSDGSIAAAGTYSLQVLDSSGMNLVGYAYNEGKVEGIRYSNGLAFVTLNQKNYPVSDLVTVLES